MQCPSCNHEAAQANFGDPLRCPDCGAFYEKAVKLKLEKELAAVREHAARQAVPLPAPVAPPIVPVKKKTSWVVWLIAGLFVIGFLNFVVNAPVRSKPAATTSTAAPEPKTPAASHVTEVRLDPAQAALASVKLEYKWGRQYDTMMIANFKVINRGSESVKDIEIECIHYGPSGTRVDSNTRTIYEIVSAHGSKNFNQFDMGFIHSQAVKSECSIVSLKI